MTLSILLYPPGGDLVLLSPKCHPEIAGVGIEYCIGFSKQRFRRVHNDTVNANLLDNVRKSLDTHNELTFEHVWRFARRSRDYLHVYRNILSSGVDKTKGVVDLTGSVIRCTDMSVAAVKARICAVGPIIHGSNHVN